MRVVCLVPSLTETLIECGVNVVGRTRYCHYPASAVKNIKVFGGTKEYKPELLQELQADLLILDREENTKLMAEQATTPVFDTHVTSIETLRTELLRLSDHLHNKKLEDLSTQVGKVLKHRRPRWDFKNIPSEIFRLGQDMSSNSNSKVIKGQVRFRRIVYVIWKDPWMCVSPQTYIGDVLSYLGASDYLPLHINSYQEFKMEDWARFHDTYFLFSSEPYPFHKKMTVLKSLNVSGSVVQGESYSWFGVRSLRFLQNNL